MTKDTSKTYEIQHEGHYSWRDQENDQWFPISWQELAEKDRTIVELERQVADLERQLEDTRAYGQEAHGYAHKHKSEAADLRAKLAEAEARAERLRASMAAIEFHSGKFLARNLLVGISAKTAILKTINEEAKSALADAPGDGGNHEKGV